ncbi:aminoacyl-tRNA hydrolase [Tomitella fengzijianii]|uniref:Peptidyl-tRNA hydrolase n=1 Tax=Tomitella fengzijianii TaxID=2597660 RepID=A0A516X7R2_9ACTN|nr:aminoacyl-tRNA hydrolase [Tomitella fengzijianii]
MLPVNTLGTDTSDEDGSDTRPLVIAGLGNPGPEYERTRHNIGFLVADVLAERMSARFTVHKRSGAHIAQGRLAQRPVTVVKPRAFMNVSGRQVAAAAKFFSVPADRLIVVHDELDLDFGTIRAKAGGGEGGHNGLRSVTSSVGTRDYIRVRVGIGRPPGRMDPASYVLKPFSAAERKDLGVFCEEAADAAELVAERGLGFAQNRLHGA